MCILVETPYVMSLSWIPHMYPVGLRPPASSAGLFFGAPRKAGDFHGFPAGFHRTLSISILSGLYGI